MKLTNEIEKCIQTHAMLTTGLANLDGVGRIVGVAVIWANMLQKLGELTGHPLEKAVAKDISIKLLAAMALSMPKTLFILRGCILPFHIFNQIAGSAVNYVTTKIIGKEAAELLIANQLSADTLTDQVFSKLGLKWKGWGKNGPPNFDDDDGPEPYGTPIPA